MDKMRFSVVINAPVKKVWDTMLNDETYRIWTEAFHEGSHYEGDWAQGSKILFLGPDDKGNMGGMVSRIKENRKYEYIAIEHLGVIIDGVEDTTGEWAGAIESYSFKETNGKTELLVENDTVPEFKEMFEGVWPKALEKLKEISEK